MREVKIALQKYSHPTRQKFPDFVLRRIKTGMTPQPDSSPKTKRGTKKGSVKGYYTGEATR
jgi:hypothetical protein